MTYFLDKNELNTIAATIGLGFVVNSRPDMPQKKEWKTLIFTHLLQSQPELKNEVEVFLNQIEKSSHTLFGEIFEGKIELKSTKEFLFVHNIFGLLNPLQKNFFLDLQHRKEEITKEKNNMFLSLHSKSTDFFPMFSNPEAILGNEDIFLKIAKTMPYSPQTIDSIIKIKNHGCIKLEKKKILCYLKLLPKTQQTYDFILSALPPSLKDSVELNQYIEDKLKVFPPEVLNKHLKSQKSLPIFEENNFYVYTFKVSEEWLLSELNIKPQLGANIMSSYYNAVRAYLFKESISGSTLEASGFFLKVTAPSIEQREKIKEVLTSLSPYMSEIFLGLDKNTPIKNWEKQFETQIKACLFAQSLEEKLPGKTDSQKRKI